MVAWLPARSHRKRPEIALVALGAVADLIGPDPAEVAPAAIDEVMRAVPRLRMKEDFKRVFVEMARRRHPKTRMGSGIAVYGPSHIPGFKTLLFETLMAAAPCDE